MFRSALTLAAWCFLLPSLPCFPQNTAEPIVGGRPIDQPIKDYVSAPVQSSALTYRAGFRFVDPSQSREIGDMPPFQVQGGVGSCFGCAASTIVQKFLCDADPDFQASGRRCADTPPELLVSQLGMVAWADINHRGSAEIPGESRNHTNLKIYSPDRTAYGHGTNALANARNSFRFMPEACFPIARLGQRYGGGAETFERAYEAGRAFYQRLQAEPDCLPCRSWFNGAFNGDFAKERVDAALKKTTYPEFLYALFFHQCKPIRPAVRPKFRATPDLGESLPKPEVFAAIRAVIDGGKPVLINAVCLIRGDAGTPCKATHSTVVSGYRRVCAGTEKDAACTTQLKLHNCWGERWQKENNDGWVEAFPFIDNIDPGADRIQPGSISWYE